MHLSEHELDLRFQEYLDQVFPDCKIAGYDYSTSYALAAIDPIAYRCGFADWLSMQLEDGHLFEDKAGNYFDSEEETKNGCANE